MSEVELLNKYRREGKSAIDLILDERARQKSKGYTNEHDKIETKGQLVAGAMAFCDTYQPDGKQLNQGDMDHAYFRYWPWEKGEFHPHGDITDLVKAAALLVAEIERKLNVSNN